MERLAQYVLLVLGISFSIADGRLGAQEVSSRSVGWSDDNGTNTIQFALNSQQQDAIDPKEPFALSMEPNPSFSVSGFDASDQRRLSNTFTSDPAFVDGLMVFGPRIALKFGGYVKADLITDLDAIGSQDFFDTETIPTSGPSRTNVHFHARQTRLSFDARWIVDESEDKIARAFVESDFFGGNPDGTAQLRLRHAYGTLGQLTVGQTWTTFTNVSAVPQTLDFEGAVSNVNRRQAMVRWDQESSIDGVSIAIAVEDPQIIVIAPPLITGQGRTPSPDFVSRMRLETDRVDLQCAVLLRELGFQPTNQPVITGTAWGVNATGSIFLDDHTKGYYQVTVGEGIGSYRGVPDVVATGPASAKILPVFGWMVGVHHEWTDQLTSNITISKLSLETSPRQRPGDLDNTTYLAVNLIANPYERVFYGIEYLYGTREDVSGAGGDAHRLQVSCGFFLP